MALDQSAVLEVLQALKAADVGDRVRSVATTIYQALIEAELTAVIGAGPHERTETRTAQRNGLPAPHVELERRGSGAADPEAARRIVPPLAVERRQRVDQALFAVVMEAHLHGVRTRRSTT
jgi:putative transposase